MQRAEQSIRVGAPVETVYRMWRNFENFPQFMDHVEEVRNLDPEGRMTHWKLKGPAGVKIEYDAELTQDIPNQSIGWNSVGGTIETTGVVTFTQVGEDQTEVHVVLQWYDPPAGPIGEALASLIQNPEKMVADALLRFKELVERRVVTPGREA